ncbi:uncharacterized protein LOC131316037 [Rhododendron vialii]|uniref:uncharacterized protein LOC131316037 n=1 Tax=Rhododendron vialii TaxID=182163 RepID=UPI00265E307F|nr:uncharacterized protein LOC131316037 [Rhododendron vialii]
MFPTLLFLKMPLALPINHCPTPCPFLTDRMNHSNVNDTNQHPFPIDALQHSNVNVTKQQHPPLPSAKGITPSPCLPDLLNRLTPLADVQGSTYRNIPDSTQVHSNRKSSLVLWSVGHFSVALMSFTCT